MAESRDGNRRRFNAFAMDMEKTICISLRFNALEHLHHLLCL
ncbi:hypothetical protein COLO4_27427 [Corchorus olitorius]|uniref:Uncharacterized protein n=1 Tax=Corchorus olitorius TaxID=93759 RepID=A0A1R3HR99_9ROSI|nr:hypothetical protein COLO4_27427 [Corchorus olitorius]